VCRPRATVAKQQANVDLPFTTRLMPRTWFGLKGHNKPAQGIAWVSVDQTGPESANLGRQPDPRNDRTAVRGWTFPSLWNSANRH
jgi:hypothetical protein